MDHNPYSVQGEPDKKFDPFFWNIVLPPLVIKLLICLAIALVIGLIVLVEECFRNYGPGKNASSDFKVGK